MADWEIVKEIIAGNPNGKSPKQIAAFLGVSVPIVYKWAENPDGSGSPIPFNKAVQLSVYTGDLRLVEILAEELGGVFVSVNPKKLSIKDRTKSLLRLIKVFGDVAAASAEALADGKITDKEKKRIHKEAHELVQSAISFDEVVQHG